MQHLGVDFLVGIEVPIQGGKAYFKPLLLENIGKAPLWQTTMQRHLSALEPNLSGVARARLLSLFTSSGCFPQARPRAATDSLLFMRRTLWRPQAVKTDTHHLLRFVSVAFRSLLYDAQQVGKLGYCSPHRIRIRSLDDLIQLRQAKATHRELVLLTRRDESSVVLNSNCGFLSRFGCFSLAWHNTSHP